MQESEQIEGDPPRIERLRTIAKEHQAVRMEGFLVDAGSALMLVRVYDALNKKNQAKLDGMKLADVVDLSWKLCR